VAGQKRTVITDANGWHILEPAVGQVRITSQLQGSRRASNSSSTIVGREFDFAMQTGQVSETVTVNSSTSTRDNVIRRELRVQELAQAEPSANVQSLQRRAAGVLHPYGSAARRHVAPVRQAARHRRGDDGQFQI
jgi:hypothetical protein